ncbi:MAG TPA: helix-turn-helix transcriptional regulator [Candidatus Enterosoma merdigallinarum]|nr:helix-turn-helix transcriptional regulator [Candidatus Enterosoma merdigallinarum]
MNLAQTIKELRKKMLVSQQELGELLGTSRVTVARWETGVYSPSYPMKRKLRDLCKENGVKWEAE